MIYIDKDKFTPQPIVSVVIITYNQEKYIGECIESIIQQAVDFPFELIISDDSSSDRTGKICLDYQKKYPDKIKVIINDENLGLIENYCNVLSYCKGKYIAQVAGDDYWCDINKLSIQKTYLDTNKDVGLVYTNTYLLDNGIFTKDFISYDVDSFEKHLLHPGYLAPNSWMYRSELSPIKVLDKNVTHYVDESYAYLLDMFRISKVAFIPRYMAVYRRCSGSLSNYNSLEHNYKFQKGIFNIKKDYIRKYNVDDSSLLYDIYTTSYLQLLENAIIVNDAEFISECNAYIDSQHIKYQDIEKLVKKSIGYKKQYQSIYNSKSYKIGKILLNPIKIIRQFLIK